jgi:hypothetical protein
MKMNNETRSLMPQKAMVHGLTVPMEQCHQLLDKLGHRGFYGELRIAFKAGEIYTVTVSEIMRPDELTDYLKS